MRHVTGLSPHGAHRLGTGACMVQQQRAIVHHHRNCSALTLHEGTLTQRLTVAGLTSGLYPALCWQGQEVIAPGIRVQGCSVKATRK